MAYETEAKETYRLDDQEDQLAECVSWFEQFDTDTSESRHLSERDCDYYDGKQLSDEEIAELQERHQPIVVKNHIAKKINFLLGHEISSRTDPKGLPRTPTHDKDVIAFTDAVRYVFDEEKFPVTASKVWADTLKAGYGGSIVEPEIISKTVPIAQDASITPAPGGVMVQAEQMGRLEQEIKIRIRRIPWDRIWYDVHSREPDFSDAYHMGVARWWYLKQAKAFYAKHPTRADNYEELLDQAFSAGSSYSDTLDDKPSWSIGSGKDRRVRIIECYYLKGDVWYVCHYTGNSSEFLVPPSPSWIEDEDGKSINPMQLNGGFCDREGIRYGLVRHMIGPQDEINKRSSKELHLLNVDRMAFETGAVKDPDEAATEWAKPDARLEVAPGALTGKKVIFENGLQRAQGQHMMLQEAKSEIASIGPEIPQIGAISGQASGVSIQQRMQIGSLEMAPLASQFREYKRGKAERVWYCIRKWWPKEKWVRVRDDAEKKGFRFIGLNRQMTKGQRLAELVQDGVPPESALEASGLPANMLGQITQLLMQQAQQKQQQIQPEQAQQMAVQAIVRSGPAQEQMTAADVASVGMDIIIDETPDVAIVQHEEVQQLREVLQTVMANPNTSATLAPLLIRMIIEAGQLRAKPKLLAMLDKPPDPQVVQQQQMQQQAQQQMLQLQLQQMATGIQAIQSQIQLNQARAADIAADAQATQILTPTEANLNQAKTAEALADAGQKTGATIADQVGTPGMTGPRS